MPNLDGTFIKIASKKGDYDVVFESHDLGSILEPTLGPSVLVVDNSVWARHEVILTKAFGHLPTIQVDATEHLKSYEGCIDLIADLLRAGVSRRAQVIAVGGGTLQDAVSFVASILFRGIPWSFVPTTILSQGDSCIGGKTSINFGQQKNQLGTYHPPTKILISPIFLETLKEIDYWSGIGEIAHYFALQEVGFSAMGPAVKSRLSSEDLTELIRKSLEIKQSFIEEDEFDQGKRLLLNFGHSFGHAIEAASNYRVPHGIAVAAGCSIAFEVSQSLGFLGDAVTHSAIHTLSNITDRFPLPEISVHDLVAHLRRDKKSTPSNPVVILSRGFGEMFVHNLELDDQTTATIQTMLDRLRGN